MSWRISSTKIFFLLTAMILTAHLVQIMLLSHGNYQVLAERQHITDLTLPAARGTIYSADGFTLATNQEAYLVWSNPREVTNSKDYAETLAPFLFPYSFLFFSEEGAEGPAFAEASAGKQEKQEKDLAQREKEYQARLQDSLARQDTFYVPLAHKVSVETRDEIVKLNLNGIHFDLEPKRAYPEGSLAAHVLGFVGKNEDGLDQGYFGLEGFYHGDLSGTPGRVILERDASGKPIPVGALNRHEPEDGRDLVLTIRRELQYLIEKKLADDVAKYDAEAGTAILMDPKTGAIWAMANVPVYQPENWTEELKGETDVSKVDIFSNDAISDNYEPGSVLKTLTMSAALNEKVVTPATTYNDIGPIAYSGHPVRTWDNKYHGVIDIPRILQLSNNTGAAWVGHQLGFDRYEEYLNKFRLGDKTGIDLQGEDTGIVRDRSEWRDIDLATMAFGQGISVTPLQLATIVSTIANDGIMMKPYMVKEIRNSKFEAPNGERTQSIKIEPKEVGRPISEETARQMQLMLRDVVEKGEFKWFVQDAGLDKFAIAGKTGTAQIPEGGHYNPNKTNVTFVGFAPVKDPKFVLLVRLYKPTASTFSAETAVPLWLEMAKNLFLHLGISPK